MMGFNVSLALGSGALLGATHQFPMLAPLQLIALAGLSATPLCGKPGWRGAVIGGLLFGLGYVGVRIVGVGLPLPVMLALAVIGIGYFVVVAALWGLLAGRPPLIAAAGFAGVCCLVEWMQVTLLPLFGTAQMFVLSWSSWPAAIGFVSITGLLGVTFLTAWSGALIAYSVTDCQARKICLPALLASLIAAGGASWLASLSVGRPVRVACVGYSSPSIVHDEAAFFEEFTDKAAQESAKLVVFPEMSAVVHSVAERRELLEHLQQLSTKHNCTIGMSYFDLARDGNFAVLITPDGESNGEYQKTHLVPGMEQYNRGDGRPLLVKTNDLTLSTMICQDDNFTDVSRRASASGAGLVAVPTLDWRGIADVHFQNSRLRAIEGDYAIARAASGGISAIVDSDGELAASFNHFDDPESPRMIVATVTPGHGQTMYAEFGDWPMVLVCVACLILAYAMPPSRARQEAETPSADIHTRFLTGAARDEDRYRRLLIVFT